MFLHASGLQCGIRSSNGSKKIQFFRHIPPARWRTVDGNGPAWREMVAEELLRLRRADEEQKESEIGGWAARAI
jgi:hypothetical protein